MWINIIFTVLIIIITTISDINPEELAKKYRLNPEEKTSYQWEELFHDKKWLKKHSLDKLPEEELEELLDYLIENAADSDKPMLPGL